MSGRRGGNRDHEEQGGGDGTGGEIAMSIEETNK
jgi:hypothetical protein